VAAMVATAVEAIPTGKIHLPILNAVKIMTSLSTLAVLLRLSAFRASAFRAPASSQNSATIVIYTQASSEII
jgi:hypothetical protein